MDEFKQKRLRYLQLKKKAGGGVSSQTTQSIQQPTGSQSPMLDMASQAIGQTPLGMASKGANAVMKGFGKVFEATSLPIPQGVQRAAQAVHRPFRVAGVGAMNAMPILPKSPAETTESMVRAFQPDYKPSGMREQIGASIGENAPAVAASILSPSIGGPLAMMAQQAQTGKVSPLPVAIPAMQGATKLFTSKILPPLLKSTKGIPTEVTRMATKDNSILDLPGTSESIQGKSQDIINAIKEAQRKTGTDFDTAYRDAGMQSPVQNIIMLNPRLGSILKNRSL